MVTIRQRLSFFYSAVSDVIPLDIIGYIGTIFWILGTLGPRVVNPNKAPNLGDYTGIVSPGTVSTIFITLALGTHLLLPVIYTFYAGPFNIRADWYPLSTDSKVHRAKNRDELRLESGDKLDIVIPVEVVESAQNYKLEFKPTAPLEIEMWDEPNDDQDWKRDKNILCSNSMVHDTFTPVFRVTATNDLGTGGSYRIQLSNIGGCRQRTILDIPVVE